MDFGKYLPTDLAVRLGHDVENPFCMALIHVAGTGLNAAACKYCMCSAFVVVLYALWLSGGVCGPVLSLFVRGKCHNPGGARHPLMRMFPSFLTFTVLAVNSAVQPASQK